MKQRRIKTKLKNLQFTVAAYAMEIGAFILSLLPPRWRNILIRRIGAIYGFLSVGQRAALAQNLKMLLAMDGKELDVVVSNVFKNFSMTLYDFFYPNYLTVEVPDREKLVKLRKEHGGLLMLTFHMGNWELGARVMRKWGWPVTAVYQPYQNKKFKKMIEKHRAPGVNFIPVGRLAAAGVRQALRQGDMVAMLGDHAFGETGTQVNLFGHRVMWPKGPIVLAMSEKAPIVVAIIIRTFPGKYQAIIEDPIFTADVSRSSVDRLVQEVADKFGRLLRQNPTQWYRFRPLQPASTVVKKKTKTISGLP